MDKGTFPPQLSSNLKRVGPLLGRLVIPILAILVTVIVLAGSAGSVKPGQVGVRVNNLTGSRTAITQPGFLLNLPMIHTVHLLDAAPQTFDMKGNQAQVGPLAVQELTVRASDGSNFHFDEFTLIFQLQGELAVQAIEDGGIGDGYLNWMRPYARSILRDEFGRESTIEVSDPSNYKIAGQRAKKRLNELLGPHGVMVTQVVTPRPKFSQEYESAIEQRNALGNQLEVIRSELARAETRRARKLAEVDREQNNIIQTKRAALESELATAVAEQAQTKREADTYRITKLGEGQATLSAASQRAKQLQGQLAAEFRAKQAEIAAFRSQPVERVMERLGAQLAKVTVDVQPYANDARPTRVLLDK